MRDTCRYGFAAYGFQVLIGDVNIELRETNTKKRLKIRREDTCDIAATFPKFPAVLKDMIKKLIS